MNIVLIAMLALGPQQPLHDAITNPQYYGHAHQQTTVDDGLMWTGIALVAGGATIAVLATTALETSDEPPNSRNLFAPCHTDPHETVLPIADCKLNHTLFIVGAGLMATGVGLIYKSRSTVIVVSPTKVTARVSW